MTPRGWPGPSISWSPKGDNPNVLSRPDGERMLQVALAEATHADVWNEDIGGG